MTAGLKWEVVESRQCPGVWHVEAIDDAGEGEIRMAVFSGPDAEGRARQYAAWTKQFEAWKAMLRDIKGIDITPMLAYVPRGPVVPDVIADGPEEVIGGAMYREAHHGPKI